MKTYVLEILLRHLQDVARVGKEDVAPLGVARHILVFATLEVFEFGLVVAFNPARLVERNGFPAAARTILVLKAILYDLKLQLPHGANDFPSVELIGEHLRHAFVHELCNAFFKLLGFHGVGIFYVLKHFGREGGQASEVELFALGERVANLEDTATVGQADDVARPGLVDGLLALRHKLRGRREADGLTVAHVQVGRVAAELSRTYLAKGDAGAVVGVDVGRDFEDEARELWLVGRHVALLGLDGTRIGRNLNEAIEQLLHTKIVEGGTEEDGCHASVEVVGNAEIVVNSTDEVKVVAQFLCIALAHVGFELAAVEIDAHFLRHALLVGLIEVEAVFVDVIHALETLPLIDRPRQWAHLDLQLLFQLVEQIEGVAPLAVHLVDEDDDGRAAHATDGHQLARLCLHAFSSVNHDNGRINGCQRAKGVFGKVLVAWRVEDVDFVAFIVELHNTRGHADAALLLDVHPVGRGRLAYLVAFHGTCHLYLSAEEQELLGQRGLTRIGVRDDGEGAPALYFFVHSDMVGFGKVYANGKTWKPLFVARTAGTDDVLCRLHHAKSGALQSATQGLQSAPQRTTQPTQSAPGGQHAEVAVAHEELRTFHT